MGAASATQNSPADNRAIMKISWHRRKGNSEKQVHSGNRSIEDLKNTG